jgi:hypothetical protein
MGACLRKTCLGLVLGIGLTGCAATPPDPGGGTSVDARNLLCAAAFDGYRGTWLYYSPAGVSWSCGNGDPDDCNDLKCTNTEWASFCYTYVCPSGFNCTVAGRTISGPGSLDICNCLVGPGGLAKVPDGTPCANLSGTCQGGVCVR